MKEDKQIYAYSWRKDLFKRIKKYFEAKKLKETTISEKPIESVLNQRVVATKKIEGPKENLKISKNERTRTSKKTSKNPETPFSVKERREKFLTYFIASAMLIIFFSGTLLANGIVKIPSSVFSVPSTNTLKPSPTSTVLQPTIAQEPTPTFVLELTHSPTPTKSTSYLTPPQTGCKISGCNGEICADESLGEISSICIYHERYQCYKQGVCERQVDGKCGWTQNSELAACLDNYN